MLFGTIVTKEEFERVQGMLAERNAESRNYRKNKGVYSEDLWRRKSSTPYSMTRMRMNNEIPKEVFGRKQQEVEKRSRSWKHGFSFKNERDSAGGLRHRLSALSGTFCGYNSVSISFTSVGRHFPGNMALQSENLSR